jgi:hypothetical protein
MAAPFSSFGKHLSPSPTHPRPPRTSPLTPHNTPNARGGYVCVDVRVVCVSACVRFCIVCVCVVSVCVCVCVCVCACVCVTAFCLLFSAHLIPDEVQNHDTRHKKSTTTTTTHTHTHAPRARAHTHTHTHTNKQQTNKHTHRHTHTHTHTHTHNCVTVSIKMCNAREPKQQSITSGRQNSARKSPKPTGMNHPGYWHALTRFCYVNNSGNSGCLVV